MPNRKKRARRRQGGFGVLLPALIATFAVLAVALVVILVHSDPFAPEPVDETLPYRYSDPINFAEEVDLMPLVVGSTVAPAATPEPTDEMPAVVDIKDLWGEPVSEPINPPGNAEVDGGEETPRPTEDPVAYAKRLAPTPMPGDYFLPIYDRALRTPDDRAMIAITVDDCNKTERLMEIANIAAKYNAKLTLFPTGDALMKNPETFQVLYRDYGCELENYTYDADKLDYTLTDGELALQLWRQGIATSYILQGDYQQHFYRPKIRRSAVDQRTHFFIRKLNLYGVASYTYSYLYHTSETLAKTLANGNIYQFDMSKESVAILEDFLSEANRKGYKMVTMNELFGLEENVRSSELTIDKQELPGIGDFEPTYYDLKLYDRASALYNIQDRLLELGYMVQVPGDHMADGIYGADTSSAVSEFQANIGHAATGDADVETQERLFSANAPMKAPPPPSSMTADSEIGTIAVPTEEPTMEPVEDLEGDSSEDSEEEPEEDAEEE